MTPYFILTVHELSVSMEMLWTLKNYRFTTLMKSPWSFACSSWVLALVVWWQCCCWLLARASLCWLFWGGWRQENMSKVIKQMAKIGALSLQLWKGKATRGRKEKRHKTEIANRLRQWMDLKRSFPFYRYLYSDCLKLFYLSKNGLSSVRYV